MRFPKGRRLKGEVRAPFRSGDRGPGSLGRLAESPRSFWSWRNLEFDLARLCAIQSGRRIRSTYFSEGARPFLRFAYVPLLFWWLAFGVPGRKRGFVPYLSFLRSTP